MAYLNGDTETNYQYQYQNPYSDYTKDQYSDYSQQQESINTARSQRNYGEGRNDWQSKIGNVGVAIMTTPYGGGDWEIESYSLQTAGQRDLLGDLLSSIGEVPEAAQAAAVDIPDISTDLLGKLKIENPDHTLEDNAVNAFLDLMDSEDFKSAMDGMRIEAATQAKEALAGRTGNYAGRQGSSAQARQEKAVAADVALKIDDVYQRALESAQKTQLSSASSLGNLALQMSEDDLKAAIADRDSSLALQKLLTQQEIAGLDLETKRQIENARMANALKRAWNDFSLGLTTRPVLENIALQNEFDTLHRDLWGGLMGG